MWRILLSTMGIMNIRTLRIKSWDFHSQGPGADQGYPCENQIISSKEGEYCMYHVKWKSRTISDYSWIMDEDLILVYIIITKSYTRQSLSSLKLGRIDKTRKSYQRRKKRIVASSCCYSTHHPPSLSSSLVAGSLLRP